MNLWLAGFADIPDNVVAVFVVLIAMMVPIVVVFTKHQQKMAIIFRGNSQNSDEVVHRLTAEMSELRSLVTQQALAIDNLADGQRKMLAALQAPQIAERISAEQ